MTWLHEHGLVSCYEDYRELPMGVLEDARLVMVADFQDRDRKAQKAAARGR